MIGYGFAGQADVLPVVSVQSCKLSVCLSVCLSSFHAMLFLQTAYVEELVSPIVTPLLLMFCLRHRSLEIVDFYQRFTVDVEGTVYIDHTIVLKKMHLSIHRLVLEGCITQFIDRLLYFITRCWRCLFICSNGCEEAWQSNGRESETLAVNLQTTTNSPFVVYSSSLMN